MLLNIQVISLLVLCYSYQLFIQYIYNICLKNEDDLKSDLTCLGLASKSGKMSGKSARPV